MLATIGSLAQGLGAAFLLSDLGAAELIIGCLVAAGLIGCAARGREPRPDDGGSLHDSPHRHA